MDDVILWLHFHKWAYYSILTFLVLLGCAPTFVFIAALMLKESGKL